MCEIRSPFYHPHTPGSRDRDAVSPRSLLVDASCSARYFPAAPSSRIPRRTSASHQSIHPKDNMSIQEYIESTASARRSRTSSTPPSRPRLPSPSRYGASRGATTASEAAIKGSRMDRCPEGAWTQASRARFARSPRGNTTRGGAFVARSLGALLARVASARRAVRSRFLARIASRFVLSAACR